MTSKLLIFVFLLTIAEKWVSSHNVLIVHPFLGGSHLLTLRRVAEALADKGHEVTIIRWLDVNKYAPINNSNITEYVLSINNTDGSIPLVTHNEIGRFQLPIQRVWNNGLKPTLLPLSGFYTIYEYCVTLLENLELLEVLRHKNFKVAIVDLIFNDCGLALAHHLGAPTIGFWAWNFNTGTSYFTPAFNPPSVIPQLFSHLGDEMNFLERVTNTVYYFFFYSLMLGQFTTSAYAVSKFLPDVPHPSILSANMSGVLINSNPALDYPRLMPPTYVETAGLHMRPQKPLSRELLEFIESSGDHGVILFSLGFNFDIQHIPRKNFENFFTAFNGLKQKVIVKALGQPSNIPPNVKIMSYLPQADILAHNKTVLFISHCGVHGVMEAVKYRVPIVGVPVYIDQKDNLVRLAQLGVAKVLHKEASANRIFSVVESALKSTSLKKNMEKLATKVEMFGDPLDKATWLIELVMDTGGADHLKLSSRNLGLLQYLCIDVLLFLICSFLVFLYMLYRIFVKINHTFKDSSSMKLKIN